MRGEVILKIKLRPRSIYSKLSYTQDRYTEGKVIPRGRYGQDGYDQRLKVGFYPRLNHPQSCYTQDRYTQGQVIPTNIQSQAISQDRCTQDQVMLKAVMLKTKLYYIYPKSLYLSFHILKSSYTLVACLLGSYQPANVCYN